MDLGDLISLIVFLVFIVSPFLKRNKKKAPGKNKPAKKSASVFSKLGDMLKEAAKEMEEQARAAQEKAAQGKLARKVPGGKKISGQTRMSRARMDRTDTEENRFTRMESGRSSQTFWNQVDDRMSVQEMEELGLDPETDTWAIEQISLARKQMAEDPQEPAPEILRPKQKFTGFEERFRDSEPRIRKKAVEKPILQTKKYGMRQTNSVRDGCPAISQISSRGLRRAVIWSEVLGKPVALRD